MEKFFAGYDYDLDGGDKLLPVAMKWVLGPITEHHGEMFWREGEQLFSVSTSGFYEPYSCVTKVCESIRIIDFAEEAWLLTDFPRQIPIAPYQASISDGIGVLLWDHTDAVWVSPNVYWEVGRVALDELEFSEISAEGIATGKGYDPSVGKLVRIRLDVLNLKVLEAAYA